MAPEVTSEDGTAKISILIIAILLAALSLFALFAPSSVYPTEDLRQAFLANDMINLFVELPVLVWCSWLSGRGSLLGRLLLPGALFYVTYNAAAAALALYPALIFLPNLLLVILSVYVVFHLFAGIDPRPVRARLAGKVRERLSAGVLVAFGALFFFMALGEWIGALSGVAPLPRTQVAVALADLLITPFWVAGGVLLWQRRPFGYVTAPALLFQASLLFAGLLVYFLLQPFLADILFPLADFLVVFAMGLFCFIPFGIYLRGIITTARG